jgi:hypothetical protein
MRVSTCHHTWPQGGGVQGLGGWGGRAVAPPNILITSPPLKFTRVNVCLSCTYMQLLFVPDSCCLGFRTFFGQYDQPTGTAQPHIRKKGIHHVAGNIKVTVFANLNDEHKIYQIHYI